jgi:hypothetical protein
MKFAARILPFTSLAATFAIAQCTQPGKFCHIIIVVQENRTPDRDGGHSESRCELEDCSTA